MIYKQAIAIIGLVLPVQLSVVPHAIHQVAWLQGCWEQRAGGRIIQEHWLPPLGGSMIGVSRTVHNGALREYELVVLREDGARLAYEAHPKGQPPAVFHARTLEHSRVVFENLAHDFPQHIGYSRDGDRLLAWIEGPGNGAPRRIDFAYRRVMCSEK